jgi:hypothetical protein
VNNSSLHSKTTLDGEQVYRNVLAQMKFGPRTTGTGGNQKYAEYIAEQLRQVGWSVEFRSFVYLGVHVRNAIGRLNVGIGHIIILGAHYDAEWWADQDRVHPRDPVPGANDAASGVHYIRLRGISTT